MSGGGKTAAVNLLIKIICGILIIVGVSIGLNKFKKDYVKKVFYKNGKLKLECQMKNWKPDGFYREYYENGVLKIKGEFKKGKPEGLIMAFSEKGKVIMKEQYENGELVFGVDEDNSPVDMEIPFSTGEDEDGATSIRKVFESH